MQTCTLSRLSCKSSTPSVPTRSGASATSSATVRGRTSAASSCAYLEGLESTGVRAEIGLYHASPRDPVWEYVLSVEAAEAAVELAEERVILVGHSHVPLVYRPRPELWGHAPGGVELELGSERWLLNPGSVGQPRDGDPHAAYLLLDLAGERASFRRVAYDVEATQAEIRERGLPDALAVRLGSGV
jgi:diadenosine tetraphosphatase ApaH/serine/threonine PP2A family protein phosphatase